MLHLRPRRFEITAAGGGAITIAVANGRASALILERSLDEPNECKSAHLAVTLPHRNYYYLRPRELLVNPCKGQGVSRKVNLRMEMGPRTYSGCFTPNNFGTRFFWVHFVMVVLKAHVKS